MDVRAAAEGEIDQLARIWYDGWHVARALMDDAESRLVHAGITTAWLPCAIGNDRAARFYEKNGWRRVGNMINRLETSVGIYELEVWRSEKPLAAAQR